MERRSRGKLDELITGLKIGKARKELQLRFANRGKRAQKKLTNYQSVVRLHLPSALLAVKSNIALP